MYKLRHRVLIASLAIIVASELTLATPTWARGFDDEYVFAATRSVNDMEMNPALKVTLFPVTIVLDTVFLPFAVIAGFVA